VDLPVFDKSLHAGQGDRTPHPVRVDGGEVDIFVLEGWSLGFGPVDGETLRARHAAAGIASTHPLSSLEQINEKLAEVEKATRGVFDAHVRIRPPGGDYGVVYKWRLEQEHNMKEKNGGKGMSDEEVRRFVDRYMPVYEVWADEQPLDRPMLCMTFGTEREIRDVVEMPGKSNVA
jgi:D-glycerate 3-kinase